MNLKINKRSVIVAILIIGTVLLLAGCNKDSSPENGNEDGIQIDGVVIGSWSGKGNKDIEFNTKEEQFNFMWRQINEGKLEIQAMNQNDSVLSGTASTSQDTGIVPVHSQGKGKYKLKISADPNTEWEVTVYE